MTLTRLSKVQSAVLRAIQSEGENAYGLTIWYRVRQNGMSNAFSLGRMYIVLDELEKERYVTLLPGDARRYYVLTEAGRAAAEAR